MTSRARARDYASDPGYAAISAIPQDQVTGKTHGRNPSRAREVRFVRDTNSATDGGRFAVREDLFVAHFPEEFQQEYWGKDFLAARGGDDDHGAPLRWRVYPKRRLRYPA